MSAADGTEAAESRKRVLELDEGQESPENRKRAAPDVSGTEALVETATAPAPSAEAVYMIKVLCPLAVVGRLIGKNGSTVNAMMEDSGAKIRFSQSNEYYPGTGDRTILIIGDDGSVLSALHDVVTRICEALEKESATDGVRFTPLVRLLVPAAVAGSIIGHGGSTIKRLSETSGCKIQMADSGGESVHTNERIVTISGTSEPNVSRAAQLVTTTFHIDGDPAGRVYTNATTMYLKGRSAVQHPRDMPRESPGYAPSRYGADYPQPYVRPPPRYDPPGPYYGSDYRPPADYGYGSDYSSRPLDHLREPPYRYPDERGYQDPYREHSYREYRAPYEDPYRDPYRGAYRPPYSDREPYGRSLPPAPMDPYYDYRGPRESALLPPPRQAPVRHGQKDPDEQRRSVHVPSAAEVSAASAAALDAGVTVGSPYVGDGGKIIVVVGVPESKMGLVLGRRGVVIQEIKVISGAQIHVSQKSVYIPGTTNRSVTVSGSEAQVQSAQSMILYQLGGGADIA